MNLRRYYKSQITKRIFQIVFFTCLIVFGVAYAKPVYQGSQIFFSKIFTDKKIMVIGETSLFIEIVDTTEERIKGLSGRESLPQKNGMLFVFEKADTHGIWMKEMNFPIDIIWINDKNEVIHIVQNAQPESYPEVFAPKTPSIYVLEVNAGFVQEHGIKLGDRVVFY